MAKISDELSYKIVTHLQDRFKQRHNIVLNRSKRLLLLNQIKSGVAKRVYTLPDKKVIYRVYIYDNSKMMNLHYHVIYSLKFDHILTVLPSKDSIEYMEFIKKHNLDKYEVDMRYMTPQERTAESIKRYLENQKKQVAMQAKQEKINEGKRRLIAWKRFNSYRNGFEQKCEDYI